MAQSELWRKRKNFSLALYRRCYVYSTIKITQNVSDALEILTTTTARLHTHGLARNSDEEEAKNNYHQDSTEKYIIIIRYNYYSGLRFSIAGILSYSM